MSSTSMQLIIVFTSLSLISALPFLNSEEEYSQFDDDDGFPPESFDLDQTDSADSDFIPDELRWSVMPPIRNLKFDEENNSIEKRLRQQFFGSRGKRFGINLFAPSRFTKFKVGSRNRRVYPKNMFVAARGKRLQEALSPLYNEVMYGYNRETQDRNRRIGFTAMRGRRSVRS